MQIIITLWYFLMLILSSIPENNTCFKKCIYSKYTIDPFSYVIFKVD